MFALISAGTATYVFSMPLTVVFDFEISRTVSERVALRCMLLEFHVENE